MEEKRSDYIREELERWLSIPIPGINKVDSDNMLDYKNCIIQEHKGELWIYMKETYQLLPLNDVYTAKYLIDLIELANKNGELDGRYGIKQ
jgi:hypothetical protein